MRPNEIERHRTTDEWQVSLNGKIYWVTRHGSDVYPEHWDVKAVRWAPNGGQYYQYLNDNSKVRSAVIKWLCDQLSIDRGTPHLPQP